MPPALGRPAAARRYRAGLVNDPAIILADEPTGNLDSKTSQGVTALFQALNDAAKTIILVTHEPDIAQFAAASSPSATARC